MDEYVGLEKNIQFINELDTYAEMKGLDGKHMMEGIRLDQRIGNPHPSGLSTVTSRILSNGKAAAVRQMHKNFIRCATQTDIEEQFTVPLNFVQEIFKQVLE
ncbi:hypothetical protein ACDX78_15300 [Virgibacillus oceani]